jgi:hypothetical protein
MLFFTKKADRNKTGKEGQHSTSSLGRILPDNSENSKGNPDNLYIRLVLPLYDPAIHGCSHRVNLMKASRGVNPVAQLGTPLKDRENKGYRRPGCSVRL